jgi:hypothetical protein
MRCSFHLGNISFNQACCIVETGVLIVPPGTFEEDVRDESPVPCLTPSSKANIQLLGSLRIFLSCTKSRCNREPVVNYLVPSSACSPAL